MSLKTREPMVGLDAVKAEIARVRLLAGSVDLQEAVLWTRDDQARFEAEIRWCVEALRDLNFRVAAVRGS